MKDNNEVFFAMRYTLKRLWNESLNAWRFTNKLFNQTVMGKQAFVNTCYLQSFMKTNTCPWGKKKLDCITSLDIQYLKRKSLRKSHFLWVLKWYPMHFPPSDRNKSKPSHEFAGDRKNLLTWSTFQTSGQTNLMTYFPRFAFNLSKAIFFAYSYFLLVCPWSVSVCLLNIFLLLFSYKMKSSFLFYRGTKQFNHAHG